MTIPSETITDIVLLLIISAVPALRNAFFAVNEREPGHHEGARVRSRLRFFDIARGAAILMVVIGHILYYYLYGDPNAGSHDAFLFFINDVIRFAIPVFLISSGALLNPADAAPGRIGGFYLRKLMRVVIPYAVMTAAVSLYFSFFQSSGGFTNFLYFLATGTAMVPYYFMIVLIQCYILYPLLARFRHSEVFLAIMFAFSFACFLIPQTWFIGGAAFAGQYLFFFAYGIYHRERFVGSGSRSMSRESLVPWAAIITLFIACVLIFPGEYFNARFFYGVAAFNFFFISFERAKLALAARIPDHSGSAGLAHFAYPSLFAWAPRAFSVLDAFGRNSLWIYLTHFPLCYLIFELIFPLPLEYHLGFFLACLIAIPVSFAAALIPSFLYKFVPLRSDRSARAEAGSPLPL